jgi:hypothetical protein
METLIDETFAKIKPTESLRLAKQTEWRKQNWSDSSGDSPVKSLTIGMQEKQAQKSITKSPVKFICIPLK